MSLKGLQFTTLPALGSNPVADRRQRVIARLEEQKVLAKDANHKRVVRRRVKRDGQNVLEERQLKIQPSWRATPTGALAFFIRLGKMVEFQKNETAVLVPSIDKLPSIIDELISSVRAGELDNQIAAASVRPTAKKTKRV